MVKRRCNKVIEKIKTGVINLYNSKGKSVGKYLLNNFLIAVIGYMAILLLSGVGFSIKIIIEGFMAAPIFAVILIVIRLSLKLLHKIMPIHTAIIKFIVDAFVFFFIWTAIAYFMARIPMPESNVLQIIISIIFDVIYISITVFLLLDKKYINKKIDYVDQQKEEY